MIVRNDIKHYLYSQVNKEYLQATTVTVQTSSNYFQLSAVYVPPWHKITSQMWEEYFQHLGDKYIAAGDYNSKHTLWGSRNTTPRCRTLEKYIRIITSIYYPQEHRHIGRLVCWWVPKSADVCPVPCEVHKTTRDAHLSKANPTNLAKCSHNLSTSFFILN